MPCSNCDKNLPIVNVKYNLCHNCNSIRTTGKSISERQAESALKYQQKALERFRSKVTEETDEVTLKIQNRTFDFQGRGIITAKQRTPIRKQTSRDAKVKSALSQLKTSIELEAVQNNEYFCKGCGKAHVGLDKSHILSVGQFKHLELVKENIQLMCRLCHTTWESGEIQDQMKLQCFTDNLAFIFFYDQTTYNKFLTRIEEYLAWLIPVQDQEKFEWVDSIITTIEEKIDAAG